MEGCVASLGKLLLELLSVGAVVELGDPEEPLPKPLIDITNSALDGGLEGIQLGTRPVNESIVPVLVVSRVLSAQFIDQVTEAVNV